MSHFFSSFLAWTGTIGFFALMMYLGAAGAGNVDER